MCWLLNLQVNNHQEWVSEGHSLPQPFPGCLWIHGTVFLCSVQPSLCCSLTAGLKPRGPTGFSQGQRPLKTWAKINLSSFELFFFPLGAFAKPSQNLWHNTTISLPKWLYLTQINAGEIMKQLHTTSTSVAVRSSNFTGNTVENRLYKCSVFSVPCLREPTPMNSFSWKYQTHSVVIRMRSVSLGLSYSSLWFSVTGLLGLVMEMLGGGALLEEVYHWACMGLESLEPGPTPILLSASMFGWNLIFQLPDMAVVCHTSHLLHLLLCIVW